MALAPVERNAACFLWMSLFIILAAGVFSRSHPASAHFWWRQFIPDKSLRCQLARPLASSCACSQSVWPIWAPYIIIQRLWLLMAEFISFYANYFSLCCWCAESQNVTTDAPECASPCRNSSWATSASQFLKVSNYKLIKKYNTSKVIKFFN